MNKIIDAATSYLDDKQPFETTYVMFESIAHYIINKTAVIVENFTYFLHMLLVFIQKIEITYDLPYIIFIVYVLTYINITLYRQYIMPIYARFFDMDDLALISCIYCIAIIMSSILCVFDSLSIDILNSLIYGISYGNLMVRDYTTSFALSIVWSITFFYGIHNINDYINKPQYYDICNYIFYLFLTNTYKQALINIVLYMTTEQPERFSAATNQIYGFIILVYVLLLAMQSSYKNIVQSCALLAYFIFLINQDLVCFILWSVCTYMIIMSFYTTIRRLYTHESELYKRYMQNIQFEHIPENLMKCLVGLVISTVMYYFYIINVSISGEKTINILQQIERIVRIPGIGQIILIWIVSGIVLWTLFIAINSMVETILLQYLKYRSDKYTKSVLTFLRTILIAVFAFFGISIVLISIGYTYGMMIVSISAGTGIFFGGKIFFENLIGSLMTLSNNKILEGDVIEVLGKIGKIEDITLFTIHLRLPDGGLFIIPFNKVDQIVNRSRTISVSSMMNIDLVLPLTSDMQLMEKILKEINSALVQSMYASHSTVLQYYGTSSVTHLSITHLFRADVISDYMIQQDIIRFLISQFLNTCRKYDTNIIGISTWFIPIY